LLPDLFSKIALPKHLRPIPPHRLRTCPHLQRTTSAPAAPHPSGRWIQRGFSTE